MPKVKYIEKEFEIPFIRVDDRYCDPCVGGGITVAAHLIGRMDLISEGDIVVDFKSSKKEPTKLELAADLQASFYMYVYRKMYGVLPQYWLVYLRPGKIFRVDRTDFNDFERSLEDYVWDSFYETLHRQSDSYKCSQCEYEKYCLADQPSGEVIFETTQEPVTAPKRDSEFFPY